MRKGILPLLGLVVVMVAVIPATIFVVKSASAATPHSPHLFLSQHATPAKPAASMARHVAAASANASANASTTTNVLTYHQGPVMAGTTSVYAIFWQPNGNVSANYNSLIERYFGDVGGSPLYKNLAQYPQAGGAFPSNAVLAATWVDTGAYSETPLLDSDIQTEVTHAQNVNGWTPASNKIFFVFTEQNEGVCLDSQHSLCTPDLPNSSNQSFCAYHDYFGSSIYAIIPYAASPNFNSGCTPGAPGAAAVGSRPNNDDADLSINLVSHEQMEAATDPQLNAWEIPPDPSNPNAPSGEMGDLCAWLFAPNNAQGADVVWNGDNYIIQEEWDNSINSCTLSSDHGPRAYELKNFNSGLAMDVFNGGTNAGAQVIQWPYKGGANQQWYLVPDNYSSFYQIVNRNSGLVLDVYNGGTSQGDKIIQWTNHHGLNQEWYLVPDGANDEIVNLSSGMVIDVNGGGTNAGANAIQWPSHNGANEQWTFKPIYYKIVNHNSGLVMDVYNAGKNAGANVIQWPFNNGANQKWALIPDGVANGTQIYQIQNQLSGLILDVFNGGTTQGVNVIQWTNHNGTNQQWKLVPYNGYYQIVNVKSNLVMDVYKGGKTQGVNVIQWPNTHGLNQQWSLVEA